MMSERLLWDRFLFQIRESGLIKEGGRILDVGTGINTTMLEMFGDRWLVTPSDINVGDWNKHIPGMIKVDAEFIHSQFQQEWDAVILSEVLEHVANPMGVIQSCYQAITWGGVLVISAPFMYRIHEYGNLDPETTEPGLKDFWRFTPRGMAFLLEQTYFDDYWVGRLVTDDKTTFPEWYCPVGVVAWATKRTEQDVDKGFCHPFLVPEDGWSPALPADWRQQQIALAQEYERGLQIVGE